MHRNVTTSDGDSEVEPGLTELILSKAGVATRVVFVDRINLERITLQFVPAHSVASSELTAYYTRYVMRALYVLLYQWLCLFSVYLYLLQLINWLIDWLIDWYCRVFALKASFPEVGTTETLAIGQTAWSAWSMCMVEVRVGDLELSFGKRALTSQKVWQFVIWNIAGCVNCTLARRYKALNTLTMVTAFPRVPWK